MSFVKIPNELLSNGSNSLVLTSSQRLAIHTLEAIADSKKKLTKTWQTIPVHSLNHWYNSLWSRYKSFHGYSEMILLNAHQEQQLWKKVLSLPIDNEDVTIVNYTQTAKKVSTAYNTLIGWDLALEEFQNDNSPDPKLFVHWVEKFEQLCKQNNFLPPSKLPLIIQDWISQGFVSLPEFVYTSGFEELTPSFKRIISAIQEQGKQVLPMEQLTEPSHYTYTSFPTVSDNLDHLENQLKSIFLDHPHAKVGIMAPSMDVYNSILNKRLTPFLYGLSSELSLDFPLKSSLGLQLNGLALVSDAIKIISLPHSQRPLSEVLSVFRSRFIKGEKVGRHLFADHLESRGFDNLSLIEVIKQYRIYSKRSEFISCEDTIGAFESLLSLDDEALLSRLWVSNWQDILTRFGWCIDIDFTHEELDQYNSFMDALNRFTGFSLVEGELTRYKALLLLRSFLAQEKYFSPTRNPSVYLLSAHEGASLTFDHLFFMGVDDNSWPGSPSPNPFIPVHVQKEQLLPHSSSERELHFSRMISDRILKSSPNVNVSYSKQVDGVEVSQSPLFELNSLSESLESSCYELSKQIPVKWVEDTQGLELNSTEIGSGGASSLKSQSSCQFQAYMKHRLGLKEYRKPTNGLSSAERGNLIHDSLEKFWLLTKTHENLIKLGVSQLNDRISECVSQVLYKLVSVRTSMIDSVFINLERARLINIVNRWVELEKSREPFSVVSLEKTINANAGPLKLKIKLDRLDKLACGQNVVIDYKTGKCGTNQWTGERMQDPQMPLYQTNIDNVTALAFGSIRPDSIGFLGISKSDGVLPNVLPLEKNKRLNLPLDWEANHDLWKKHLSSLGQSFKDGEAKVNPININFSCAFCPLKATCRIHDEQP